MLNLLLTRLTAVADKLTVALLLFKERFMTSRRRWIAAIAIGLACAQSASAQIAKLDRDPACHTLTPASAGGAMPKNSNLMVLRYLGTSNYEIDYRGHILLLDAYFDGQRGPQARLIGFKADDITRADAIFVGHPHFDHLADGPALAKRLGIPIFVSPAGRPILQREQVPSNLARYVSGGETIKMDGYTVMTALARHSSLDPKASALYHQAAAVQAPMTTEESRWLAERKTYNPPSTDPEMDIPTHGTISYVFVFDNGFKVAFRDSPGVPTDSERELVQRVGGSVDVAILGYNGFGSDPVVKVTLDLAKVYQPKIFLPAHQDALFGGITDFATMPLFLAFRDQLPGIRSVDPLYRTPICVDTSTKQVDYDPSVSSSSKP
jgi:L-ascorbate metabolism protein UlaG (beta-lactamase superfamily)